MPIVKPSHPNLGLTIHLILLAASIAAVLTADGDIFAPNLIYFPVNGALFAYSALFALYFKNKIPRVALASLLVSTAAWFAAEIIWSVEELILNTDPYPSSADIFYMLGYPFLLFFLHVVGKTISASPQIKTLSAAVAFAFIIPTIAAATITYDEDPYEFVLASSYTVFDALLIWVTLNKLLSIGNKSRFWQFVFAGVVLLSIADSFFIVLELTGQYYTGHPIELFFLGSYLLMSFALYGQIKLAKSKSHQNTWELFGTGGKQPSFLSNIILVSSSVMVVVVVSMMVLFGFDNLTTNEMNSFVAIVMSSLAITTVLSVLTYVLDKKLSGLKTLERQYLDTSPQVKDEQSFQFATVQERISVLERTNKKTHTYAVVGMAAMVVIAALYFSETTFDFSSRYSVLESGQYLVEDRNSQIVTSQVFWKINPSESIQIDIVNAHVISDSKIEAIKSAILSEETLEMPNSKMGKEPEDLVATYYLGWRGALMQASTTHTEFPIPVDFQIFESDKAMGDITIILSDDKQQDGTVSFTNLIADENERQILKAYITIYDVKNLNNYDLEDIMRHEFAHAIGVTHKDQSNFNLHDRHAYVSQCNIDNIVEIYNGIESHLTCD